MWTETARASTRRRVMVQCAEPGCTEMLERAVIHATRPNYCAHHRAEHQRAQDREYKRGVEVARRQNVLRRKRRAGPLSSLGQHQSRKPTITIIYDPCEWPMAVGAAISQEELAAGLRLGSFVAGTVFRLADGRTMTVGGEQVTP